MVEHVSLGTVHAVYRDLEMLHRDIGHNVEGLEEVVASCRAQGNRAAEKVAAYVEKEVENLKDRLLHVERVQQRLRNLGFAPDETGS